MPPKPLPGRTSGTHPAISGSYLRAHNPAFGDLCMKLVFFVAPLLAAQLAGAAPALEGAAAEAAVLVPSIETHRICKTQPVQTLEDGKREIRAATMAKYKISEQEYEKYYANGVRAFKQQWDAMPEAQQRKICQQWKPSQAAR